MEMACAPGGPLNDLAEQHGIIVQPIKNFVSEIAPIKDIHALWQVYRLLYREKYDLIHTYNSKGGFVGRPAAKEFLTLTKHFSHVWGLPGFRDSRSCIVKLLILFKHLRI